MQLPHGHQNPPSGGSPEPTPGSPLPWKRLAVLAVVLVVFVFGWQALKDNGSAPAPAPAPGQPVNAGTKAAQEVAAVPIDPTEFARGKELSQQVCSTCHLYPEPALLDKFSWSMEILPKMALWLGFDRNTTYDDPGGRIKAAKIIPTEPLFKYEDWAAICNYYAAAAPTHTAPQPAHPKIQIGLKQFTPEIIKYDRPAKNLMVRIDESSGLVYVSNEEKHTLDMLDRDFKRVASLDLPTTPVDIVFAPEGLFLTLIGNFLPSDEPAGQLLYVPKPGSKDPGTQEVFKGLQRPVCTQIVDLNGDGKKDVLICEFGNWLGRLGWQENLGNGRFQQHDLLDRPGAIKAVVRDMNGDGAPDIVVMMAQAREGIYLFLNNGHGQFTIQPIAEFPPTWGSSGFELVDFNGDGLPDILATNGDNGDTHNYPAPLKGYHGVRLYLNDGNNHFHEAFFYPMNGAYKAIARDFNQDGKTDIIAISYFPDYNAQRAESCVYLENKGNNVFEAYSFAESISGHWINMDVGDIDGDGDLDVVLCSYLGGPGPVPNILNEQWEKHGSSLLVLRNNLFKGKPAGVKLLDPAAQAPGKSPAPKKP